MSDFLGKYKENYEEISSIEKENNISSVFTAINKTTKKPCCLKVINKKKLKLGDYDFLLEQIQREEEITKLCNSNFTINFIRKLDTEDNIIFELEYFENNLKDYLQNNGELSREKSFFKEIILSVTKALKIINQNGIIHRDIKPDNIFYKTENGKKIVKLGDFGGSIFIKDNTSEPLGTILYTAPEILKNVEYDEKCDLWSLGVSLYELYFGFLPFGPKTTPHSIKKAIYNEKRFIFQKTENPILDILFKGLLTIDPKERITFKDFFDYVLSDAFLNDNISLIINNPKYKKIYDIIQKEPKIDYKKKKKNNEDEEEDEYDYLGYMPESNDEEKIQKICTKKILHYVQGDHLPDIMSYPNGSTKEEKRYNNIIYYDENINYLGSIYNDSDYFERNTPGAFILCTNLESLRLVREEILKEIKKDKRITFNLITTGSNCEKVLEFIKQNKDFEKCILNVCIYCLNIQKYLPLKIKYEIIHDDIYNTQLEVVNFINMFSAEEIKPFPITKVITYEDYKDKYNDRHFKISQFYGNLTKETYDEYYKKMKHIIEKESKSKELKIKEKDLSNAFLKFDIKEDLKELDRIIIKEYTKQTFHGDLNKWLMNSKMNFYEPIAYFTSRLMYSLNKYAIDKNMFCQIDNKVLYRGVKLPYSHLLPYERAKGKIILLSGFTSTTESSVLAQNWAGRAEVTKMYKNSLKFSVVYIITNKYTNGWVSCGINIEEESEFPGEKEFLFQPFSFYRVKDVQINIKNYTADIFLELIGKYEILEEKIKFKKEVEYNKLMNIMQIKN